MLKRICSLVLSLLLLGSLALPVFAEESQTPEIRRVRIVNLKNLEKLAENCRLDSYSHNLVVSLEADLDLTDSDFQGIPIFGGTFEGNGHTIRGLDLTQAGSVQGFFRYLTESALVEDLQLEGNVQPGGSGGTVGGFVGENKGILRNCSFSGTVSGTEYVGGIAGDNTVSGTLENCRVSGTIYGDHFVGGLAGQNKGTIRVCENHAAINETARQNQVDLTDITLDSVIHSESANTITDVGGIAGNSSGMIRNCINDGMVGHTRMGYNIGGIAGTQSGSIIDCENRGVIRGRKEVGGIVGQMEPSAVMEFEEDVLQILNGQMDKLGRLVSEATSNLQGAGDTIVGNLWNVQEYIWNAQDSAKLLLPEQNGELDVPDWDTIQAAKNGIGSSLMGISRAMEGVSANAYSAMGKVSTNLHEIKDQMNAMRATLDNISETTGGSIVDRSDEDTEADLTGKVWNCRNSGDIRGDLNCGGIAGAMAMENDLDMEEDWLIAGENSLNFESEIRAVILNCDNDARITVGKQNAGGIVGFQSLGLVKDSRNTGYLDAQGADYVGGISGRSMGYIRYSAANGELLGSTYVGGIAGSAAVTTDCYALVRLENGTEKLGAILGSREENYMEVEDPISNNHYLPVREDPGGIDGISYHGLAQPMDHETFFRQEDLPELFRHVTVTFRYGNGTERKYSVDFGTSFPEDWIPPIPIKEGRQSYWKGMEEADLACIFFDQVFEQAYTNQTTVLESELTRNAVPLLFVQGIFAEDATLQVEETDVQVPLEGRESLLEVWQFRSTEPDRQDQIRLQLPETADAEHIRILIRSADQAWRREPHHVLGRYAVASLTSGDDAIALVQEASIPWLLILSLAGILSLSGLAIHLKRKKK